MYKGFNLQLKSRDLTFESSPKGGSNSQLKFQKMVRQIYLQSHVKKRIHEGLEKYLNTEAVLDGTMMQEDWFPNVNAHVFISHSHQDEKLAGLLADKLYENFKILSFIDSFVWGFADELLKKIDDKYCKNKSIGSYDYKKRNYSTSHVHMMLATALTKMIDKAECLVFLNTPNSVSTNGIIAQTYSPWIYHEIATTKTIRIKRPGRVTKQIHGLTKEAAEKLMESLKIGYKVDFDNLTILDHNFLGKWVDSGKTSPQDALDFLYEEGPKAKKTTGRFFNK
jgi:hypothetical protein